MICRLPIPGYIFEAPKKATHVGISLMDTVMLDKVISEFALKVLGYPMTCHETFIMALDRRFDDLVVHAESA
jgi:hypothetical protein